MTEHAAAQKDGETERVQGSAIERIAGRVAEEDRHNTVLPCWMRTPPLNVWGRHPTRLQGEHRARSSSGRSYTWPGSSDSSSGDSSQPPRTRAQAQS